MFDVSQIGKRYFDIRLVVEDDSGETHSVELQIEPPTVKQLQRLLAVAGADDLSVMDDLRNAVCSILRKNKTRYMVPDAYVENLDFDQLSAILTAYMEWVAKEKQGKN